MRHMLALTLAACSPSVPLVALHGADQPAANLARYVGADIAPQAPSGRWWPEVRGYVQCERAAALVDDLAATLPPVIDGVGYSQGGTLLALYAARHPERVRHVTVYAAVPCEPSTVAAVYGLRDELIPPDSIAQAVALGLDVSTIDAAHDVEPVVIEALGGEW